MVRLSPLSLEVQRDSGWYFLPILSSIADRAKSIAELELRRLDCAIHGSEQHECVLQDGRTLDTEVDLAGFLSTTGKTG